MEVLEKGQRASFALTSEERHQRGSCNITKPDCRNDRRHGCHIQLMSKFTGASTFGELSEKYYNIFSAQLFSDNCV